MIRKVLYERCQQYGIGVAEPKKAGGKGKLLRDFERFLRYADSTPGCGAILVLLDSDDCCPKQLGLDLAARSKEAGIDKPIVIVCAKSEYEAWFLASLDTIKGKPIKGRPGITEHASFTGSVEDLRGVKEWLTQQMPVGRAYKGTSDQAPMTENIDLNTAHSNSRSFQRLFHAVELLVVSPTGFD